MVRNPNDFPKTDFHKAVKAQLIERFQSFPLDSRLPSTRALTEELGASYVTVNRILQEMEWEGYIKRVPRKGTFLASRERTVRKDVNTGTIKLQTILFAYPNYFSYPTWQRLSKVEEAALKRGMAVCEYKMNPGTSYEGLRKIIRENDSVCGVVVVPVPDSIRQQEMALFDALDVPVVLLDECDLVSCARGVWSISPDWYQAGYLAIETLVSKGHTSFAMVKAEPGAREDRQLRLGIRQALIDAGIKQRDFGVFGGTHPWESSREAGYNLFRQAVETGGFTALVYDSVCGVRGATRAAWEMNVRIPDDLSLLCLSSDDGDEAYFAPPLTTMTTSDVLETKLILECILEPDANPTKKITLPSKFIERESVRAVAE
ncbi:MAG: LacI family DNA-binding transcriptional regulator [Planctomycetes bacterium]|nr:LacI family DNA-binding transcriptional regulator [Planctomycetota bacterium]